MKRLAISVTVSILLGACASQPTATRYYLLESDETVAPAARNTASATLAIGPVSVPAYLDQPLVVTRGNDDVLELHDADRWAMPLGDAIRELILARVSTQLPRANVVAFPGSPDAAGAACRVAIDVVRFDGAPGATATLDARWRLFDGQSRTWGTVQKFGQRASVAGSAVRDLVAAQGMLAAQAADAIAGSETLHACLH